MPMSIHTIITRAYLSPSFVFRSAKIEDSASIRAPDDTKGKGAEKCFLLVAVTQQRL
jgi:hypothetical protein